MDSINLTNEIDRICNDWVEKTPDNIENFIEYETNIIIKNHNIGKILATSIVVSAIINLVNNQSIPTDIL